MIYIFFIILMGLLFVFARYQQLKSQRQEEKEFKAWQNQIESMIAENKRQIDLADQILKMTKELK